MVNPPLWAQRIWLATKLAAIKNLHRALCDPYLQRHAHQGMGHAVAVTLKLDVLVDVNLHRLEHSQLPGLHWQRSQSRCIDLGKDTGAAPGQFLKRLVVELHQERRNGLVDLIDSLEFLVAQAHQNPALHHLYGRLSFGLVLRVAGPRGQHRGTVMAGKVQHRVVGTGLVAVGVGNQGLGVVGHDEFDNTAIKAQGLCGGAQPIGGGFTWCGVGEGVA